MQIEKLQEKLLNHGVDGFQAATKMVISTLIATKLQSQVTVTGDGVAIVFGLKNTRIFSLVKDTIMELYTGIKAIQVHNVVRNYLKRSSDRKGGLPRAEKRSLHSDMF